MERVGLLMYHAPSARLQRRPWRRCFWLVFHRAAGAAIAWLTACSDGTGPSLAPPSTQVSLDWVTPDIARLIAPNGQFIDLGEQPEEPDELGLDQMLPLLTSFNRTIPLLAGNTRALVEREHGAPVDFESLVPCGRPVYLASSVLPLNTTNEIPQTLSALQALRLNMNGTNARWIVSYCDRNGDFVLTHTRSTRTRVFVGPNGLVSFDSLGSTGDGGGVTGLPRGTMPLLHSRERSVELVYRTTGVRVASVPRATMSLIQFPSDVILGTFWRTTTETPVSGRIGTNGSTTTGDEFYTIHSASAVQDGQLLDTTKVYVAAPDVHPPWWRVWEVLTELGTPVLDSSFIVPRWAMRLYEFIPDP